MATIFQRAADLICRADGLVVAAGAGMSTDSGVPDYYGTGGFYGACPPGWELQIPPDQVMNPLMFERNPHLVWGYFLWCWRKYSNCPSGTIVCIHRSKPSR